MTTKCKLRYGLRRPRAVFGRRLRKRVLGLDVFFDAVLVSQQGLSICGAEQKWVVFYASQETVEYLGNSKYSADMMRTKRRSNDEAAAMQQNHENHVEQGCEVRLVNSLTTNPK